MATFQQLRYLVALAETGHFRRAAETCNVTQPTLSLQIKKLEDSLNGVLIERGKSRVHLTRLGEQVVVHARSALKELEDIRTISRMTNGSLTSTIRVGVVQSLGSYLMPLIVPDLHKSHPKLKLYIREGLATHLLAGLRDASLDVLFFPLPVHETEFETLPIFSEPLCAVVPVDHVLADRPAIRPDMLRDETIMSLEPGHRLNEHAFHFPWVKPPE